MREQRSSGSRGESQALTGPAATVAGGEQVVGIIAVHSCVHQKGKLWPILGLLRG